MSSNLSISQLKRREGRFELLISKIRNREPLIDKTGVNRLILTSEADRIEKMISSGNFPKVLELQLHDGTKIASGNLKKTAEFGGESSSHRLKHENRAIEILQDLINDLRKNQPFIRIKVGTNTYEVAGVRKTPKTPKSDFELLDQYGNAVAFISHKHGVTATPRSFGHWSSIGHFIKYSEVENFLKRFKKKYKTGANPGTAVGIKIDPKSLLSKEAIYGKEYGGDFSRDNVNIVLQGIPRLEKMKNKKVYELTGVLVLKNGDVPPKEYEPVLCARFQTHRVDLGLTNTRVTIYPIGGRKLLDL